MASKKSLRKKSQKKPHGKSQKKALPPFSPLLLRWLAGVGPAAFLFAIVELALTRLNVPLVFSSGSGSLAWLVGVMALGALYLLPWTLLGALVEQRSWHKRFDAPADLLTVALASVITATGIYRGTGFFFDDNLIEFPRYVEPLKWIGLFGVVAIALIGSHFFLLPGLRRVFAHSRIISRPKVVPAFLLFAAFLLMLAAAHLVLAPVYMRGLATICSVIGLGALGGFSRMTLPMEGAKAKLGASGAALVIIVVGYPTALNQFHAAFVLHAHSHGAEGLSRYVQDALDFDDDHYLATWLGGTDCDEFNPAVGPGLREIPGDKIDQDCRGGDPKPVQRIPREPWFRGCTPTETPSNVLLITIDALRADAFQPALMPKISMLAQNMQRFRRAYTTGTSTHYALSGLFTGKATSDLTNKNVLEMSPLNLGHLLASRFTKAGYRTIAHDSVPLDAIFQTGFSEYNPDKDDWDLVRLPNKTTFSAAKTSGAAIRSLDKLDGAPFFMWLHYIDAHAPYAEPYGTEPESAPPYERLVQYVDFHVSRVLAHLADEGLHQNTMVVITSDHGEDLGFRGREGHGFDVYEDTIRVPLLVWAPGCPGRDILAPVSNSQIAPTLAAAAQIKMDGATLFPAKSIDPVVAEAVQYRNSSKRAIIGPRHKMIVDFRTGGRVLFDLKEDPFEEQNIYGKTAATKEMETAYQRWLDSPGKR